MRRSIAVKIFAVLAGLFLFVLLIQWFFISRSFNRLYEQSIYTAMQSELDNAIAGFRPKGNQNKHERFMDYAMETGSPIMVLSENYQISDWGLIQDMRLITVSLQNIGDVHIPVAYLEDIYGPNAPFIASGRRIDVELVPIGNGTVYEPLSLRPGDFSFKNRTSIEKYRSEVKNDVLTGNGLIVDAINLRREDELATSRAEFIFGAVKDCLIFQSNIAEYLDELCKEAVAHLGFDYRFMYDTLTVNGVTHYFVTAQRVVITGFERSYIDQFFYLTYSILGFVLVIAALMFSRWLSSPLKRFSQVTEQIASLDFSSTVTHRSQDEMGQLAGNINKMSDSLQQSLHGLEQSNLLLAKASEVSHANEDRMKLLLADLAHEFKTPLGLVSGYLEVIQQGIDPAKTDSYYQIIEEEIDTLTDLVDETVELTKLQSGYWRVNRGHHSLKVILNTTFGKFDGKLSENGFTVERRTEDVMVYCDAFRIGQVISNFLSNALKYSDEHKRIVVTTEIISDHIKISVANSGRMSSEEAERIWGRYHRAEEFASTRLPSQGIGLDIVKKILEAHGSEYCIEQTNGMICFIFTLPLAQ